MKLIPDVNELWIGIGGTFDTFGQDSEEFCDNSLGNIIANKTVNTIIITIDVLPDGRIRYTHEDSGTGIKNIEKALTIGNKEHQESVYNEHGFGMKHAFASANPENDSWSICTRTKDDLEKGIYHKVEAPYEYDLVEKTINEEESRWPGELTSTGTICQFICSREFFDTVQQGIGGRAKEKKCLDYFSEELGYVYSRNIKDGEISIILKSNTIRDDNGEKYYTRVKAIEPNIVGYYPPEPNRITKDLGGGEVIIEYKFCEIKESNYAKYYLKNQATAGAEIRLNGRLILKNVFKDIWGVEMHPQYNHFLCMINIISNDRRRLPKTRTTKNGVRLGDEKLNQLYKWIRSILPTPPRTSSGIVSERALLDELKSLKDTHLPNEVKRVEREFEVYRGIDGRVKVDLYVFDGQEVIIYEGKKEDADIQSVYQLRMYWDGCVCYGISPDKSILIASRFPNAVIKVVEQTNQLLDLDGNKYNIILRTWQEEKVSYPK